MKFIKIESKDQLGDRQYVRHEISSPVNGIQKCIKCGEVITENNEFSQGGIFVMRAGNSCSIISQGFASDDIDYIDCTTLFS